MSDITAQREHARPEMSGPVLGMVLFVASEAMFFAAFFGGYFTIRANAPVWPPPDVPHLKIDIARRRQALWWLGATIGLGVVFLGLQLYDYSQLGFGLKDGVFGTLFYVMTGIHMAHVIGGVAFLALVFGQGLRGRLSPTHHDPLAAGAIYWDFVDVVWLCLFTTFYLLTPR